MPRLNPWFVTGVCQRSASFTYSFSGNHTTLYFSLKFDLADKSLAQKIKKFFKAGRLYYVRPNYVYYRVSKLDQLINRIIKHFDSYPLSGKTQKIYQIWKKMALLKKKNFKKIEFRWKPDELQEFKKLVKQLSKLSTRQVK